MNIELRHFWDGPARAEMTATNRTRVLIVTAIAVTMSAVYFVTRPDKSLRGQAVRLMNCVVEKNADCVLEYIDQSDQTAYQLNVPKVKLLLDEFHSSVKVNPSRIEVTQMADGTLLFPKVDGIAKNGKLVSTSIPVSDTEEGIKSPQLVTSLLLIISYAEAPSTVGSGVSKLLNWADYANRKGDFWTKNGFSGVLRSSEEGLIEWKKWKEFCEQRARYAQLSPEERQKVPKPEVPR